MTRSNGSLHGLDHLRALRDEIRLKVHLGGMDAKNEWRTMERELDDLQARAGAASDHLVDEVKEAIRRLEPFLEQLGRAGI